MWKLQLFHNTLNARCKERVFEKLPINKNVKTKGLNVIIKTRNFFIGLINFVTITIVARGIITVTNEAGTVTLDKAYQSTMVSTISTMPAKPVTITNITDDSGSILMDQFTSKLPDEIQLKII